MPVNWDKTEKLRAPAGNWQQRCRRQLERWLFASFNEILIRQTTLELNHFGNGKLDGLRVVALSDLHARDWHVGEGFLASLIEAVNRRQPDLIFLLGDYVDRHGDEAISPEEIAAWLGKFKARYGILAVLGNHDIHCGKLRLMQALSANGIDVLSDSSRTLSMGDHKLQIAGAAELWTEAPVPGHMLHRLNPAVPTIVLTHAPDLFKSLPSWVALTLAGHTHAGQVRLPWLKRFVIPSQIPERYDYGIFRDREKTLVVSAGIGTSRLPLRINCPPEILELTLKNKKS